ncbi:hypothetical protein LCM27_16890 [Ruegeria marisrubri]|uniref:hypothetical protein n=1 Tax=Ruegeria marisrubri TaxID=1685379 RepID=UPI001CD37784|nr:hypothetical protein [Ruegeria marisrubri]MCA0908078.1 hypothetical protein [Ruegeria marisrubri]
MSDDEGGNGIFEDAVAAKNSKNWEARLKEAREKRARVLSGAQGEAQEKPALKPSETEHLPRPDETKIEEIVSDRVRSLHLEDPKTRKKPLVRAGIILAALVCGAFLQWAVTHIAGTWRPTGGTPPASLDAATETLPEIEELLSDRASIVRIDEPPAPQAAEDPADPASSQVAPVSNPAIIEEVEDAITGATLDQSVSVEAVVTSPGPAEDISAADDQDRVEPIPPAEPAVSVSPPAIFIPPQLEPILATVSSADVQTLYPASAEPPWRHTNRSNKDSFSQTSLMVLDPVQQEITLSAAPSYAEVKPLSPTQSPIDLEVSLFVPLRVSQDASSRALELLTQGRATVVSTDRVGFRVRETQVRFYHPSDAENAALAADALDGILRDFTNSGSKTRPGRIEVYLAGSGGTSSRNSDTRPTEFDKFIARILGELR